jgi:hypothetical protein
MLALSLMGPGNGTLMRSGMPQTSSVVTSPLHYLLRDPKDLFVPRAHAVARVLTSFAVAWPLSWAFVSLCPGT